MGTIAAYIKQVQNAQNGLLAESEAIVVRNEDKITNLNKNQFTDGYGSDDKGLFNQDRTFSGRYTPFTNKLNPAKSVGELYDFFETGAFIQGLFLKMSSDKLSFSINSTGTGTGDKALFFSGYTNLFGLDSKNSEIVNYQIVLPEILDYLNTKM